MREAALELLEFVPDTWERVPIATVWGREFSFAWLRQARMIEEKHEEETSFFGLFRRRTWKWRRTDAGRAALSPAKAEGDAA